MKETIFPGPTGAIVLGLTPFWWSQGAAADTETRPRHQLGHGVVNVAPRVSLNHPKQTVKQLCFPTVVLPTTAVQPPSQTRDLAVGFVMTNLDDPNRGCRTGARKTRAWPPADPTKTCSDHPLRSIDSPSLLARLYCHFGTSWNV